MKELAESTHYSERLILKAALSLHFGDDILAFHRLVAEPRDCDIDTTGQLAKWLDENKTSFLKQFWPIREGSQRIRILNLEMDKQTYTVTIEVGKSKYEP